MAKKKSAPRAKAGAVRSQVRSLRGYGWVPDLPDQRDRMYRAPARMAGALPRSVDLRPGCPLVYDQGQLGSCTANAIAAALQFDQIKQGASDVFAPSRLFIYYNERVIEHDVPMDNGAQIREVQRASRLGRSVTIRVAGGRDLILGSTGRGGASRETPRAVRPLRSQVSEGEKARAERPPKIKA